jgi:hypothetical protein
MSKGPYTKPDLARTVACPLCDAEPGEQCRTAPGHRMILVPEPVTRRTCVHGERHRAYLSADEAWLARQVAHLDAELAVLT